MKKIITVITLLLIVGVVYSQSNEKQIKFNEGTLKICTSSHMKISGYDGDEVIIRSNTIYTEFTYTSKPGYSLGKNIEPKYLKKNARRKKDTPLRGFAFSNDNKQKLEKGLKPLGDKSTNPADNLYLDIEKKEGELIIRNYLGDVESNYQAWRKNIKYEILIPNSIKLLWNTENCTKINSNPFPITSKPWELSNFKGEAEISSTYGSINLTDVSGPVIANTIGGNIKVIFDKVTPTNLYSLISNDGYIDVQIPKNSNLNVHATGDRILSDIDFKVLNDNIINGVKEMKLQLNSGKTRMKLDAGFGSIYLRKK